MQISAINSGTNFGQSHSYRANGRLSEDEIKEYALKATVKQSQERSRNIKRLFYSVPLLAGISTAILHKGNSKVLSKELSGAAGKIAEGFKSGGSWAFLLGTGAAIAGANSVLAKKSDGYMNFRKNHPVLSVIGDIAAFIGISIAAPIGLSKLASKMPNQMANLSKGIENLATHINGIKTPKFIKTAKDSISKIIPNRIKDMGTRASANIPESLVTAGNITKETGKVLLSWAPHIAFFSAILTGLTSGSRFMGDFVKNYETIKQQVNETKS